MMNISEYFKEAMALNEEKNISLEEATEKLNSERFSVRVLTEANLNRVVNGHDEYGYAILSACRSILWKNKKTKKIIDIKPLNNSEEWIELSEENNKQQLIDENNKRTKNLKSKIKSLGYSFVPVFGGYKEDGQSEATFEKSFMVFPYDAINHKYEKNFNDFKNDMLELGNEYNQDTILLKEPNKNPIYYDCKSGNTDGKEFSGKLLNDVAREYFTSLKKWDNDFTDGSPQR